MIVVCGSINVDFVCRVERFPAIGETLQGLDFALYPGGKGANQALAATRAGAKVRLYGAVGQDMFAEHALTLLRADNVDLGGVARASAPTGCANVLVDAAGDNCIVIVAGANAYVDPTTVPDDVLASAFIMVLQQELSYATNAKAIAQSRRCGARVVLNAAPARWLPLEQLRQLDVLVVNTTEARALAATLDWPHEPRAFAAAGSRLIDGLAVIVTMGKEGAIGAWAGETHRVEAPHVNVIDTTGAGDAFVGVLAASLDAGMRMQDAMRRAVAAGSLACTMSGAQAGLPRHDAIEALLPTVTLRRC